MWGKPQVWTHWFETLHLLHCGHTSAGLGPPYIIFGLSQLVSGSADLCSHGWRSYVWQFVTVILSEVPASPTGSVERNVGFPLGFNSVQVGQFKPSHLSQTGLWGPWLPLQRVIPSWASPIWVKTRSHQGHRVLVGKADELCLLSSVMHRRDWTKEQFSRQQSSGNGS